MNRGGFIPLVRVSGGLALEPKAGEPWGSGSPVSRKTLKRTTGFAVFHRPGPFQASGPNTEEVDIGCKKSCRALETELAC
jgi:hypothetical protein